MAAMKLIWYEHCNKKEESMAQDVQLRRMLDVGIGYGRGRNGPKNEAGAGA